MEQFLNRQESIDVIIKIENLHPEDKISYDKLIELSKNIIFLHIR